MYNLKNNEDIKKNNSKITTTKTATTLLLLGAILLVVSVSTAPLGAQATRFGGEGGAGFIDQTTDERKAPTVVSGDNVYVAWWTNNTANGNEEVMFRSSTDGGATFSNSTNLSNTTDADSWRVEIAGEGDTVVVSWWETNQTSDVPVARVSNDGGETFGPLMMLGMNGTLGSGEAEAVGGGGEGEEEAEGGEEATPGGIIEEAVGGPEVAE